ncbi:hypothetical protein A2U01_0094450, partial [Trifolium medium]|nr:hypothetical protein [Trifolium medium]
TDIDICFVEATQPKSYILRRQLHRHRLTTDEGLTAAVERWCFGGQQMKG